MKQHIILILIVFISKTNGTSQIIPATEKDIVVTLAGPPTDNPLKIPSRFHDKQGKLMEHMRGSQNATITVTYDAGFTPAAQAAFQYAVDIWESILKSNVTIRVNATWQPNANANNLGSAYASYFAMNDLNYPSSNTRYPAALADALAGIDKNANSVDINANFNSNRNDWYFGTDANPPGGQYDLVSVVLHEIGHGLGFTGRAWVNAPFGYIASPPNVWDTFLEFSSNTPLLNFQSDTLLLFALLQSNDLWFDGPNTNYWNGGRARIYAPNPWISGSSYSHLDEATHSSALMSPSIGAGQAVHDIPILDLAILDDLGWELNPYCSVPTDLTINNLIIPNHIASGVYFASNSIATHSTTVASGQPVIFRAGNVISITGTSAEPFRSVGTFIATAGGEYCDVNTSTAALMDQIQFVSSQVPVNSELILKGKGKDNIDTSISKHDVTQFKMTRKIILETIQKMYHY